MPWLVGIDEAGYGPNLGPFVMSMVGLRVPAGGERDDLWRRLARAVCRVEDPAHGRLLVDDSKKIHAPAQGLARLERQVLPFLLDVGLPGSIQLETLWHRFCLTPLAEFQAEPWYLGSIPLPVHGVAADLLAQRRLWDETCAGQDLCLGTIATVIVFPRRFNTLIAEHDSKAAAPLWALRRLLAQGLVPAGETCVHVWADKLGSRNHYRETLQDLFTDGLVMTRCESARDSSYQVRLPQGTWEISFQPGADARHFPVALASMVSKYWREVLMTQFNRFWQAQLPELRPTAGYPRDAARFYTDIQAVRTRLGIADETLWRVR
jgi:ribonuclease HII